MKAHLIRIMGFGLVPLLSIASSVALLPLISSRFGEEGWIAVSLGSSTGAIVGVLVALDWPIWGTQRVAEASEAERIALYYSSLRSRAWCIALLVPAITPVWFLVLDDLAVATALFFVAYSLNGLTASWFFIGVGRPKLIVMNESLVRLVAYAVSLVLLLLGMPLWAYPMILILAGVLMPALGARSVSGSWRMMTADVKQCPKIVRPPVRVQLLGAFSRTGSQAYYYLIPTIGIATVPSSAGTIAAFDQGQKAMNNALSALPQAFQWWVGSPRDPKQRSQRVRWAIVSFLVASVLGFCLLVVALPTIFMFLFAGKIDISLSVTVVIALAVSLTFLATATSSLVLAPLHLERHLYKMLLAAGVTGVATQLLFAQGSWDFGEVSGMLGLSAYAGLQCLVGNVIGTRVIKRTGELESASMNGSA